MEIDDVLNEISESNSVYQKGNYNSLLSVISSYEKDNNYSLIIDIIDENYSIFTEDDKRLTLINKKIQALLRLEDYNAVLNTLIIKSAFRNLDYKEKANILFYEAICYEALNETYKAISSLEAIEDSISRIALVNKYLKLALLYIKNNELDKASSAYQYASQMDSAHKNDIFSLIESDLYYCSGDYNHALDSFESFFLKSNSKYKYLDRYIYILMKLNRFDDAYNFYHEYKDKTSIRLSNINKYNFYKAASILLKRIEKYDELYIVNSFIEEGKPTYFKRGDNERDEYINRIVDSISFPLTIYDKYKNIANKFFKLINDIPNDELIFIEKNSESFIYSKFNNTELKPNILTNELLRENDLYDFFDIRSDVILDYFYNQKLNKIDSKVKAYVISDSYHYYGYFLVSYNEAYDNIYNILKKALLFEFIRLDEMTKGKNNELSIIKTIESSNSGYIRIKEETVELFTDYTKRLFSYKKDMMPFSLFKDIFIDDIYVDSFLNKEVLELTTKDNKTIEFKIVVIDDTINALVKDITISKKINDERNDYFYFGSSMFYTINALKDIVNSENESYSILGLYLPIIEPSDLISKKDSKLNIVYNFLNKFSPSSTLYYLGENHFLYRIDSVDKRILEAIFNNIEKNIASLYRYTKKLREEKSFGFASKNLKNKTYDQVKELIEYGFFVSRLENRYLILDNIEKKNYALFKTYETEIKKYIDRKELDEIYYPIINHETSKIHYFLTDFIYPYDLKHDLIEKIFRSEELLVKRDMYSLDVAINNLKEINDNFKFIVRIHSESLLSPSFYDYINKIDRKYINNFYLYIDTTNLTLYKDKLLEIKKLGYTLAISIDNLSFDSDFSLFRLVFSSLNTDIKFNYELINTLIDSKITVCMTNKQRINGALNLDNTIKAYSKDELKKL